MRKYHYNILPMGLINPSDIFKQKINELFQVLYFITPYTSRRNTGTNFKSIENKEGLNVILKGLSLVKLK